MGSSVVIKVKHGETLRRFNALINEDGLLDLDMARLKEKVLGLFGFAHDVDLTLAYIDEDGDMVTLADEEDLHDVMKQSLNPLRITVKLNAEKGFKSCSRSISTPMGSPRVQLPFADLSKQIPEILKIVSEPARESLLKMVLDLDSKSASSAPALDERGDCFSKMGQSCTNMLPEFQAGIGSGTQREASTTPAGASINKELEVSEVDGTTSEAMCQTVDLEKGSREVEASVTSASGSLNHNCGLTGNSSLSVCASANSAPVVFCNSICDSKEEAKKFEESLLSEEFYNSQLADLKLVPSNFPDGGNKNVGKLDEPSKSISDVACSSGTGPTKYSKVEFRNTAAGQSPIAFKNADLVGSVKKTFPSLSLNECPFSGLPFSTDSAVTSTQFDPHAAPFKRSYCNSEGMRSIFHPGVICDGCGVNPITGPRFKSKVKEDYDLCCICFSEMGTEADYIRLDYPDSYRHPYSLKMQHRLLYPSVLAPNFLRSGMKQSRPKFDCHFIRDVSIPDGTIMAPSTLFTKIWKMRNSGAMAWPRGTQLVWIRGDKLSNVLSIELQIPPNGIPVDGELDVAIDFVAPELPGQYISHWTMASQSGRKFGECVWVLIQVDASQKDSSCGDFYGLNLNFPPVNRGTTVPEMLNMNIKATIEDSFAQADHSCKTTDFVGPSVDAHSNNQELSFQDVDDSVGNNDFLNPVNPDDPLVVSYPTIDSTKVRLAVPLYLPRAPDTKPASAQGSTASSNVEQLLKELEDLGFKQAALNKKILKKNGYNLAQTVEDLCDDSALKELEEMGFCDIEMNMRLLKKYGGSIKKVVMHIITGED